MSYSELMDITDYISMAELSFDNRISSEQRVGVVHDLEKVMSRLNESRLSHPELSGALIALEERAERCRNVFKNLYLKCVVSNN